MAEVVLNIKEKQKEEGKLFVGDMVTLDGDVCMFCQVNRSQGMFIYIGEGNRYYDQMFSLKEAEGEVRRYINVSKLDEFDYDYKILKNTKITIDAEY